MIEGPGTDVANGAAAYARVEYRGCKKVRDAPFAPTAMRRTTTPTPTTDSTTQTSSTTQNTDASKLIEVARVAHAQCVTDAAGNAAKLSVCETLFNDSVAEANSLKAGSTTGSTTGDSNVGSTAIDDVETDYAKRVGREAISRIKADLESLQSECEVAAMTLDAIEGLSDMADDEAQRRVEAAEDSCTLLAHAEYKNSSKMAAWVRTWSGLSDMIPGSGKRLRRLVAPMVSPFGNDVKASLKMGPLVALTRGGASWPREFSHDFEVAQGASMHVESMTLIKGTITVAADATLTIKPV